METGCANPLLVQWLKEWLDLAIERSSKGILTYKRAYDSIKACPIPFDHPSQSQQLAGIGEKLANRLTKKMKEYCEENELPMPTIPRKKRKRTVPDGGDDDNGVSDTPAVAEKPKKKKKPYVPALRSGPYAILLALSTLERTSSAGMTKIQLIEEAQPHCDSSFTAPTHANSFYTAWDSMKTLQNKDLVYEWGRPSRKYALSDDGWEIAARVRNGLGNAVPPETFSAKRKCKETNERSEGGENSEIDSASQRILHKSPIPGARRKQPVSSGYKEFHDAHHIPMTITPQGKSADCDDNFHSVNLSAAHKTREVWAAKQHVPSSTSSRTHLSARLGSPTGTTTNNEVIDLLSSPSPEHHKDPGPRIMRASGSTTKAVTGHEHTVPKQTTLACHKDNPPATFEPFDIPSNSFTVELVIDQREVRTKDDRAYIQDELRKRSARPIVRSLEVGDALWVAKLKDPFFLSRFGEEGDEIMLDYIVERKRMDDLISSIRDGRFYEQKFRLRQSGVKNVIYIIEELRMNTDKEQKIYDMVQSAIASTQVVNGYFVKRTKKLDDTIRYLAHMTKILKEKYEASQRLNFLQSSLRLIPSPHLSPTTYLPLLSSLTAPNNITYASFASMSSKSDILTLRDIYLKMLMCTRGVTGERALEIQRVWNTPRKLVEAMERGGDGDGGQDAETGKKRREELAWGATATLYGRKKVGKVVSCRLSEVWWGD